jgi:hypothetical protein
VNVLRAVQSGNNNDDSDIAPNESNMDGLDSDDEAADEDHMDTDEGQPAQPLAFQIDPDIDINSPALKDMISMDPIVSHETPLQPSSHLKAADTSNMEPDWNW